MAPISVPQPAAAATPSVAPTELTVEVVLRRWSDVLEAARSSGARLRTALSAAEVDCVRGDMLVLRFAPDAGFQRAAVTAPESQGALAALLEKTLGRKLRVETIERSRDPLAPAPADEAPRRAEPQGERLDRKSVV